jgi:hypothetical protein
VVNFRFLVSSLDLGPVLDSNLVPVVLGLGAGVAGFLPALWGASDGTRKPSDATKTVTLILLFVTIVVTLVAALSSFPVNSSHLACGWIVEDIHAFALELLCLLASGQLLYLFRTIQKSIAEETSGVNNQFDSGWTEVADLLYEQEKYRQAIASYEEALARAPEGNRKERKAKANIWAIDTPHKGCSGDAQATHGRTAHVRA